MRISRLPIVLIAGLMACSDDVTTPRVGSLSIAIDGLPAGVHAGVVVTSPGGFRQDVGSGTTLTALVAGPYTIVAAEVTAGGVRYVGAPATQGVMVGGDRVTPAAPIAYAPSTGRLTLTIAGLPAGAAGSVTLDGPAGFSRVVTSNAQLDLLTPGTYTLTAADVIVAGIRYRATPAAQILTLAASALPVGVAVNYGAGTSTLRVAIAGLPGGTNAAVTITGPGGTERLLTSSATIDRLAPGPYTVSASTVGTNLTTYRAVTTTQQVTVVDGATHDVDVSYVGSPLRLGLQLLAQGLTQPVFLTAPIGDARQFIVERPGRIRVVDAGVLLPTPFLDIRGRVNSTGERGMLSMAFDPAYATTGLFYVFYVDLAGNVVVERFASTPGASVAGATAGIVISIPHGGAEHHGGQIAFAPDGTFFLAPGDGRCCGDPNNNAQTMVNLLGKILRIDVRTHPYTIPPDNPYANHAGWRPEIWAHGLRNPWRFSFDDVTGTLFVGDVGQDAREEVNAVPFRQAGLNYGWRYMEGSACYNPSSNCTSGLVLQLPIYEYTHADGCSVTGGYVYRGSAIPELTGHYMLADYCRGWVRSFRHAGSGVFELTTWAGITATQAVSFGQDGARELYLIAGTRAWRVVRQ